MCLHWKTIIPVCLGLSVLLTTPYLGLTRREPKEWGALIAGLPTDPGISLHKDIRVLNEKALSKFLKKEPAQKREWRTFATLRMICIVQGYSIGKRGLEEYPPDPG